MTEKRNIHALIEKEAPSLNNLLDPNDVKEFKAMTAELRDTWTKKQVFRTETEMRMSVLQDMKYPTKAAKYWQCVREQNVFLENLMSLSFDCRRNEVRLKKLEQKLEKEEEVFQNFSDHKSLNNIIDVVYDLYYKDWPQRIIIDRGPVLASGNPGNFELMKVHYKRPFK